jgi:transcriptional regulator with XRE-family HTH domain
VSEFGKVLRQLRKEQGVIQRELGPAVGVHYTYISHLEAGRLKPSAELVYRIARYLDVDAFELCASAGKVPLEITVALELLPVESWRRVHHIAMSELRRISA